MNSLKLDQIRTRLNSCPIAEMTINMLDNRAKIMELLLDHEENLIDEVTLRLKVEQLGSKLQ